MYLLFELFSTTTYLVLDLLTMTEEIVLSNNVQKCDPVGFGDLRRGLGQEIRINETVILHRGTGRKPRVVVGLQSGILKFM